MKLSRTLLPIAAIAMLAAPTIASAAAAPTAKHHHKVVKHRKVAAKPAKVVKTTETVTKTK